jgi:hypothetical protein
MIVMREWGTGDSSELIAGGLHRNYMRGTDDVTVRAEKRVEVALWP